MLKLEIHDATGTVIDDWKAKYGASLVAEMGDPNGNAGTFKTDFFVTSAMLAGDVVTVIAVSEDVRRFKIPPAHKFTYQQNSRRYIQGIFRQA